MVSTIHYKKLQWCCFVLVIISAYLYTAPRQKTRQVLIYVAPREKTRQRWFWRVSIRPRSNRITYAGLQPLAKIYLWRRLAVAVMMMMIISVLININDNCNAFTGKRQLWCLARFMPVKSRRGWCCYDCSRQKRRANLLPLSWPAALFPWPLNLLGLSVEIARLCQQLQL